MHLLMKSNFKNPINIGNPNEFTIKELANLVRDLINPNLSLNLKTSLDDPMQKNQIFKWLKKNQIGSPN